MKWKGERVSTKILFLLLFSMFIDDFGHRKFYSNDKISEDMILT